MYEITRATAADIDGITDLLQANSANQGGSLTGEFPRDKVAAMTFGGAPVIVAHREGQVVGVIFSSEKNSPSPPSSIEAMLTAWPGAPDAYVYGPVCIASTERGQGLLARLYSALQQYYPSREAVLFIRRDNFASLRAHGRLGMHEVAAFVLDGADYVVLSDCPA